MISGHGPFSHMFDQEFIPAIKGKDKWKVINLTNFIPISVCLHHTANQFVEKQLFCCYVNLNQNNNYW